MQCTRVDDFNTMKHWWALVHILLFFFKLLVYLIFFFTKFIHSYTKQEQGIQIQVSLVWGQGEGDSAYTNQSIYKQHSLQLLQVVVFTRSHINSGFFKNQIVWILQVSKMFFYLLILILIIIGKKEEFQFPQQVTTNTITTIPSTIIEISYCFNDDV